VIIDKVSNLILEDEPRITLNYSRIYKDLLGIFLELSLKVHNNLSNPRYRNLIAVDLKYAYIIIPLYLDNRYYFAFTIFEIR